MDRLGSAFGQVIRERRLQAGLSQEQLAEAADLHRNYIGLVERGTNSPSLKAITSLAKALGTKPSDLLSAAEDAVGKP